MKKLLLLCSLLPCLLACASEKMYFDQCDVDTSENAFHIHIGFNEYISTEIMRRDASGLYTLESDLVHSHANSNAGQDLVYKKTWKCPYCHQYFEVGSACDNANCPSKYPTKK